VAPAHQHNGLLFLPDPSFKIPQKPVTLAAPPAGGRHGSWAWTGPGECVDVLGRVGLFQAENALTCRWVTRSKYLRMGTSPSRRRPTEAGMLLGGMAQNESIEQAPLHPMLKQGPVFPTIKPLSRFGWDRKIAGMPFSDRNRAMSQLARIMISATSIRPGFRVHPVEIDIAVFPQPDVDFRYGNVNRAGRQAGFTEFRAMLRRCTTVGSWSASRFTSK